MSARAWTTILLLLLVTRLPAVGQPAGSDQSLYTYVAQQLVDGRVPYVDAWDQKPPGIFFIYAVLLPFVPATAVPAVADVVAAALVAWLLVVLGDRIAGRSTGYVAAAVFLLFGHPAIARLSGLYVRGQCEIFVALAVTASLVLLSGPQRVWRLGLAGACLGAAFWIKYNALVYVAPVVAEVWIATDKDRRPDLRTRARDLAAVAAGFAAISVGVLGFFAWHRALDALWLSTVEYNVRYSSETYSGLASMLSYPVWLPVEHARVDFLWFAGGLGALLLVWEIRSRPAARLILLWLVAAILSISVNGARDLPQYFVQAGPPLALAAAAGLSTLARRSQIVRVVTALAIALGLWKVGVERDHVFRLGGLPQLVSNVHFDVDYLLGRVPTDEYLGRFKGEQKYDARAIADLTAYVKSTTRADDRILVFGFAPGVYVASERTSASRFCWSRPVVIEFEAGRPGWGSAGLLEELQASRPAIIALQKRDWGPGDPDSAPFFMSHPDLAPWLQRDYALDRDTAVFAVWRRRS